MIIYRDDDLNVYTCPYLFKKLHNLFIEKKQVHTVAVCMKDLWENYALFRYLVEAPYLEVGLHGWEHKDYSVLSYEECYEDLKKSLDYWKVNCKRITNNPKKITVFYAPWNRGGENIIKACTDLGLKFCNVRKGKWEDNYIRSFHWWNIMDDNWKPI